MKAEIGKNKILFNISTVASTTLNSVRFFLNCYRQTDQADLRSLYILLSFSCELIFKYSLAKNCDCTDQLTLNKYLKKYGHSLKEMADELGKIKLKNMGIEKIKYNQSEGLYNIALKENETIKLYDLTHIRYGWIQNNKRLQHFEYAELEKVTTVLESMLYKIKN